MRSRVTWVKVKYHVGQGQRSTLKVRVKGQGHQSQICDFRSHLIGLQVMFEVKGHMGQGQRSCGSRSKVTWVKPSLKVMILAGGLISTSSCIFNNNKVMCARILAGYKEIFWTPSF